MKPLSLSPSYFSFSSQLMVPPQFSITPIPLVLCQFFITRNHDNKYKTQKKNFFTVSLHRSVKCQGHVMLRSVEDNTSGQLYKTKNQRKNWENFEKNVKFSSSFRKCKFKKMKNKLKIKVKFLYNNFYAKRF